MDTKDDLNPNTWKVTKSTGSEICSAIIHGNGFKMAELLKEGDFTATSQGLSYLHQVARCNKLKLVAPLYALCNYGELFKMVAGDESEFSGLTAAEIAKRLKNRNALQMIKMHELFEDSLTELHIAARAGDIEQVKTLCETRKYEYNVDVSGLYGNTPLYTACVAGRLDVVTFLQERGASLRRRNDWGDTMLHRSARWGQLAVVKYLIETDKYIDVNSMNYDGDTSLHMAALYGSPSVVQQLIECGANPMAKNNNGRTPLHYAMEEGHGKVFLLLNDA